MDDDDFSLFAYGYLPFDGEGIEDIFSDDDLVEEDDVSWISSMPIDRQKRFVGEFVLEVE